MSDSSSDRVFAMRFTLGYVALCAALVAGHRIYQRLDIVEGEVAYATERISALESDVSDISDRLDEIDSDTANDDTADPVRFDARHPSFRGR